MVEDIFAQLFSWDGKWYVMFFSYILYVTSAVNIAASFTSANINGLKSVSGQGDKLLNFQTDKDGFSA